MKVLFVTSEMVPFAKTGGLADVAGSLPLALAERGEDVVVIMPKYKCVNINADSAVLGNKVKVYFVKNDKYFFRDNLYTDKTGDYPDNLERFSYFSRRALEMLKEINFKPDVIHCHDWQTALIPVYLKSIFKADAFYKDMKAVFTIHNLSYQGLFAKEAYPAIGLGWELFTINGFEFYGKANIMKAAIIFSDIITTVSPTYAKEIQTQEFGCGLEGVLKVRSSDLYGILNGLDYTLWNPALDDKLYAKYSTSALHKKYINKSALMKGLGLKEDKGTVLIGSISRLVDHKGFDLVTSIVNELAKLNIAYVLLAVGEKKYEDIFISMSKARPWQFSVNLKFDAVLAQRIYAASDIFLMPSKFEPCGLGQMISLKYGAIPVVRKTGGLADSIIDYDENPKEGNGFVFSEYTQGALLDAIKRALRLYADSTKWQSLLKRAMKCDFSWKQSAKRYVELYERALKQNYSHVH